MVANITDALNTTGNIRHTVDNVGEKNERKKRLEFKCNLIFKVVDNLEEFTTMLCCHTYPVDLSDREKHCLFRSDSESYELNVVWQPPCICFSGS